MEALSKLHLRPPPPPALHLAHHSKLPFSYTQFLSISFPKPPPKQPSSLRIHQFKASSSPSSSSESATDLITKPHFIEALKPFLKSTCVAIAATVLVLARFNNKMLPAIAAPIMQMESERENSSVVSDLETERKLEEYLSSHPDDVDALRSLMELKIKKKKFQDAIDVINRLIEIEPEENEWPLLKAHLYSYTGDNKTAKLGFEEVLKKDPLRVDAFHGLVMAVSQSETPEGLKKVVERIEQAMDVCKKERKKEDVRDFNLLIAQIRVIEGNYNEALKVYQGLVKEEPRDFRPYLCQGIIYTLLKKNDEAEKQFQKYKRLVPKEHPYAQYFDDNMIATKVFSQKDGMEIASPKQ